jgi:hypothetical protein
MVFQGFQGFSMFEGDYADTCAGNFRNCWWVAGLRVSRAQTREQGPPSVVSEIHSVFDDFEYALFWSINSVYQQ